MIADKIVGYIYQPTPQCVLKCSVDTKYLFDAKKDRYLDSFISFNFEGKEGIFVRYEYALILEQKESRNQNGVKNKAIIRQKDVFNVQNLLNTVYNWLLNPSGIYTRDSYGVLSGVKDVKLRSQVNLDKGYIAFKPCVIQDAEGMMYEGVGVGNQYGEISNFTCMEFASFRLIMQSLLTNMYQTALLTVNNAYLNTLYRTINGGK